MPEAVVPPLPSEEAPKPKRKYTRRKKTRRPRVPKIAGTVPKIEPVATMPAPAPPRPRYGAPKALEEVDRQLAAAIAQKPAYHEQLANLFAQTSLWQQKLDRLVQQIQELVSLQRQLDGETTVTNTGFTVTHAGTIGVGGPPIELDPRVAGMIPGAGNGTMFGEVPQGVSSIPARQPKPTSSNVADEAKKMGGWE